MMQQRSTGTIQPIPALPGVISGEFLAILRRAGVIEAHLFGSTVRDAARHDSDIDLLVRFEGRVTLFQQLDLAEELSHVSGRPVDLMTRIDPAFAPYITPELVPLPL